MFGLFKKSEHQIAVNDKVWLSKAAKYQACRQMLELDMFIVFITWFEETADELNRELMLEKGSNTVFLAKDVFPDLLRNRTVVFVEHYPLREFETSTFHRLMVSEANVLLSLDEPLLTQFGGERMIVLMQQLGTKDNEVLSHNMISRAIRNAQDRIAQHVKSERPALSQQEWFRVNWHS